MAMGLVPLSISLGAFVLLPLLLQIEKATILWDKQLDVGMILLRMACFLFFVGPIEVLLFGLWHFPTSLSLTTVLVKALIGFAYALCKVKIKHCTTLSVSLAHGLHETTLLALSCLLQ